MSADTPIGFAVRALGRKGPEDFGYMVVEDAGGMRFLPAHERKLLLEHLRRRAARAMERAVRR